MTEASPSGRKAEAEHVRRMRAQLLTVVSCVLGMVATYLIAATAMRFWLPTP